MDRVVGVDVHKREHVAVMLDAAARPLGRFAFANDPAGFAGFIAWLDDQQATDALIGIENAGGYGCTLARALADAGRQARDVPSWRTAPQRRALGPGKSDAQDAEAIARVVLAQGPRLAPACEPELVRALGLLEAARRQEVRDRTKVIQRLRAIWTTVDPAAEAAARRLSSPAQIRRLRRIRLGPGLAEQAAERCIRALAGRIGAHSARIGELEVEIGALLAEHGNPVAGLIGGGPIVAAQLIAHAGDPRRFAGAAAFAAYCGTAPVACGSGMTGGRHRLNRAGNRQLNCAIHRIAMTQARLHPDARRYLARKRGEGKTDREARRALKRHLTNVVYRRLTAWAEVSLT